MRAPEELARLIDHALLHPALSRADLENGLALCRDLNVWSVCVKACDVRTASQYLAGSGTRVCSVVSFPHGNSTTYVKLQEAEHALGEGARELDYVINVAAAIGGDFVAIREEMDALNRIAQSSGALLKAIFENAYLGEDTLIALCRIAKELQVGFVKTSTGFAAGLQQGKPSGATLRDVRLMVREVSPVCQVKASGGIRDLATLEQFLAAGATRVGTSATRTILEEARARLGGAPRLGFG